MHPLTYPNDDTPEICMKYIFDITYYNFMCNNSVLMVSTMRKKLALVIGQEHLKEKAVCQKQKELNSIVAKAQTKEDNKIEGK